MRKGGLALLISLLLMGAGACGGGGEKVRLVRSDDGWRLLVGGKPYFVRGLCYAPVTVGEDADKGTWRDWMFVDDNQDGIPDFPYQSWVDKNRNNIKDADEPPMGDFRLLQQMGVNTIRLYHHASALKEIQALHPAGSVSASLYNHAPNKVLLRDLFQTYGIRVAMGDFLGAYTVGSGARWDEGTDYRNPRQRANMLRSVEAMVREFKNEPYILLWIIGNENNYPELTHTNASTYPEEYARFVNEAARRIKKMDPHHPVALANGETNFLEVFAKHAPDVDIFGLNSYREGSFGDLWEEVASVYNKPVLLTEYGAMPPPMKRGILDEHDKAITHLLGACDMERHQAGRMAPGSAIGGFAFRWLDGWLPDRGLAPAKESKVRGWHPDRQGVASQGDGRSSPWLRQLREAYFMYQALWLTEERRCPPMR